MHPDGKGFPSFLQEKSITFVQTTTSNTSRLVLLGVPFQRLFPRGRNNVAPLVQSATDPAELLCTFFLGQVGCREGKAQRYSQFLKASVDGANCFANLSQQCILRDAC